jgi:hypothetical protein
MSWFLRPDAGELMKTKLTKGPFLSAGRIFCLYILVSFVVIGIYRLLVPGERAPLGVFSVGWRINRALLDFANLFPALAAASLILPFGLKVYSGENFMPFSPHLLEQLKGSLFTAVSATVLYSVFLFFVLPAAQNAQSDMRFKADLFRRAKEKAEVHFNAEDWLQSSYFFGICEKIWPGNTEVDPDQRVTANIRAEECRIIEAEKAGRNSRPQFTTVWHGQWQGIDAAEALNKSYDAFGKEHYYDAHWLASLSERLAADSGELQAAAAAAKAAWDKISSLELNAEETRRKDLYQLKLEGYDDIKKSDWIGAYYIFHDLVRDTPDDPDVHDFLAMSLNGLTTQAFFTDEIERNIGRTVAEAFFSLPIRKDTIDTEAAGIRADTASERGGAGITGRAVIRFSSLSIFDDYAYGIDAEVQASNNQSPLWNVKSENVKLSPITVNNESLTILLLRSLDKNDSSKQNRVEWTDQSGGMADIPDREARLLLDINYRDFLLITKLNTGLKNLSIGELLQVSQQFGFYGFIPETFQAEILYRFSDPAIFLCLAIFGIALGWRFRLQIKTKLLWIPMLVILPVVINGVVHLYRIIISNISILAVVSLGYFTAGIVFIIITVSLLILSLITLASQHG